MLEAHTVYDKSERMVGILALSCHGTHTIRE